LVSTESFLIASPFLIASLRSSFVKLTFGCYQHSVNASFYTTAESLTASSHCIQNICSSNTFKIINIVKTVFCNRKILKENMLILFKIKMNLDYSSEFLYPKFFIFKRLNFMTFLHSMRISGFIRFPSEICMVIQVCHLARDRRRPEKKPP